MRSFDEAVDAKTWPICRVISTRRGQVLHIVADSWRPDGGAYYFHMIWGKLTHSGSRVYVGHLERFICFTHDADLTKTTAEFDADFLLIIVPRRISSGFGSPH